MPFAISKQLLSLHFYIIDQKFMIAKNNNGKNNEKKGKDSRKKKVRKLLKLELRSYSSILIGKKRGSFS